MQVSAVGCYVYYFILTQLCYFILFISITSFPKRWYKIFHAFVYFKSLPFASHSRCYNINWCFFSQLRVFVTRMSFNIFAWPHIKEIKRVVWTLIPLIEIKLSFNVITQHWQTHIFLLRLAHILPGNILGHDLGQMHVSLIPLDKVKMCHDLQDSILYKITMIINNKWRNGKRSIFQDPVISSYLSSIWTKL